MAGFIGRFVFKKILKETIDNNYGKSDAFFERTPARRLSHVPEPKLTSNKKKLRKALPPGLSENDQAVLVKVKRRAYMLDMSLFSLCGLRFGWSSVLGLIPAIGDMMDMFLALMVVRSASEVNLPSSIKLQMLFNVILDFIVGLIPLLGDLADAAYKVNTRNAIILENFLRERGQENIRKQGMALPPDLSLPQEFDQQPELHDGGVASPTPRNGHGSVRKGTAPYQTDLEGGQQKPFGGSGASAARSQSRR